MAPHTKTDQATLDHFLLPLHGGAVLEVRRGICKGRWAGLAPFLFKIEGIMCTEILLRVGL